MPHVSSASKISKLYICSKYPCIWCENMRCWSATGTYKQITMITTARKRRKNGIRLHCLDTLYNIWLCHFNILMRIKIWFECVRTYFCIRNRWRNTNRKYHIFWVNKNQFIFNENVFFFSSFSLLIELKTAEEK